MIRCVLTCFDGRRYEVPTLLEWRFSYTAGVPCDSFWFRCLWSLGEEAGLRDAVTVTALWKDAVVFEGVVDECECRWDEGGCTAELSGRGMAARLLDNEAMPADYQVATAADILRDHVTPYGVAVAGAVSLPPVSGFSVASGSSEWQVLYQFARYYGGVAPRFDRTGRLLLEPWSDGTLLSLDETVPVTALRWRERRYGVLSEILVRDKVSGATQRVENKDFAARGGRCRRVLTMPGRSNYQAMRYSGEFQLGRSRAEQSRLELTVALAFYAWPGDLARVQRPGFGRNGVWRVLEAETGGGAKGFWTTLTLGEKDAVV